MPSVAACDAAGAMSAAAHAASKVVLIRIRAPGEELGMRHGPRPATGAGVGGLPNAGAGASPDCGADIPPEGQPSEETRQPSSTGTSSRVSCDGAWPDAELRTSALALFSSSAIVIL